MRQHEPPERGRRQDEAAGERRAPEAEATILGLQRSAGNQAVSALLARQPAPADSREALPTTERGATMTLGLGDDIGVIPLDSASWGEFRKGEVHDLHVSFLDNPAVAQIQQAALRGAPIPEGFYSTTGAMARMKDILVSAVSFDEGSSGKSIVSLTVNFASMKVEPVR